MTETLLAPLLESWDRHNTVLLNLLRTIPPGGLDARAHPESHTVAELFTHLHHERMCSVMENVPEYAGAMPATEWHHEPDAERIAAMLRDSGERVREAVRSRIDGGRALDKDFPHPLHLVQFLIFHDSYHHGQIKVALKASGMAIPDAVAGPVIWDVWRGR